MDYMMGIGHASRADLVGDAIGAVAGEPRSTAGAGRVALAALGLGGLLFGGLPLWAARRILYPPTPQPLPHEFDNGLTSESGLVAEYAEYPARDGGRLSGWFVPGPESAARPWPCVMLVYGYGGYKEQMIGYAQMMHDAGFATFMFDMQGSGLRRSEPVTLGYKERWDMMDAVSYVRTRSDVNPEQIGALGISMGGATALLAAEEDPSIKAVVADSAYANLSDMVKPGLRAFVGRPATVFAPLIVRYAETMLGMKSSQVRPEEAASRLGDRPLFVIHGADDDLTDPNSARRIFAAARGPKELWVIPDCGHALGPVVAPGEYQSRIGTFLMKALGVGIATAA